jgi:hypothetical protein
MKAKIWILFVVLVLSTKILAQDSVYFSIGENYALKVKVLDSVMQAFSEYNCEKKSKILYAIQILEIISIRDSSVYKSSEEISQVKYLISSPKSPCLIKGKEHYIITTNSIDKKMLYLSRFFENKYVFRYNKYSVYISGLDMPCFKLNILQKIYWRIQIMFSRNKDETYKRLIKKHKERLSKDLFIQYVYQYP